jgi:hypothetical protein
VNDDGADRHFVFVKRDLRLAQRLLHEELMRGRKKGRGGEGERGRFEVAMRSCLPVSHSRRLPV